MRDIVHHFAQAIEAAGISPPASIVPDARLHRFSTNGNVTDTAGWYVLFGGDMPAGVFGCWRSGFQSTWSSKREHDLSPLERHLLREQVKNAQRLRDVEQMRIQQITRGVAGEMLARSRPVPMHPYLAAKDVAPISVAAEGNLLLVPIHDNNGLVHSLQTIDPSGKKRFLPGGKLSGHYFGIGVPGTHVIVCEGYATGLTIHMCTGMAVAVAFFAGNLTAVAQAQRRKYPNAQIIVAADDDWATPRNPGRTAAKIAALAVGGYVALPIFPGDRPANATDFNDLYSIAGGAAVAACFADIERR